MKLNESKISVKKLKAGSVDPDFIPYAFHYDSDTLATKCGSLIKIIEISDLNNTSAQIDPIAVLRGIMNTYGKSGHLAFWFFNIRETKDFTDEWEEVSNFANVIHKKYFNSNPRSVLRNKMHIAMATKPFKEPFINFLDAIFHKSVARRQIEDFRLKKTIIDNEVETIFGKISENFVCRVLGMEFEKDNVYSEILSFLWKILSGKDRKFEVEKYDISRKLSETNITFGTNIFMLEHDESRNFGVVLEIKNYNDLNTNAIQKIMQLDCDFIITEYINHVPTRKDVSKYMRQSYLITVSLDESFLKASGLHNYIEALTEDPSSRPFCEHKTVITLFAPSHAALKEKIRTIFTACSNIGLLTIRHDLRLEEVYWMRIPANFHFVTGTKLLPSTSTPGFIELNSESYTKMQKYSDFREVITTFYTMKNNPFRFSFQKGDTPKHMLIIGYDITFRVSVTNFLISEAEKLKRKCFILDSSGFSTVFVNAFSGKYKIASLNPAVNTLKINPFKLSNTEFNRETIVGTLKRMVGRTIIQEDVFQDLLNRASDIILNAPDGSKNMSSVAEILKTCGNDALRWLEGGPFCHFLTDDEDEEFTDIYGINLSEILNYSGCTQVLLYYLLRKFESMQTTSPKILVMEEILQMCTAFNSEEELKEWSMRLTNPNFIVIFGSSTLRGTMAQKVSRCISESIGTIIMLPNSNMGIDSNVSSIFKISNSDKSTILKMPSLHKHLLIKQADESILVSTNIKDLIEDCVLSSSKELVKFMNDSMSESNGETNGWLPLFLGKCEVFFS